MTSTAPTRSTTELTKGQAILAMARQTSQEEHLIEQKRRDEQRQNERDLQSAFQTIVQRLERVAKTTAATAVTVPADDLPATVLSANSLWAQLVSRLESQHIVWKGVDVTNPGRSVVHHFAVNVNAAEAASAANPTSKGIHNTDSDKAMADKIQAAFEWITEHMRLAIKLRETSTEAHVMSDRLVSVTGDLCAWKQLLDRLEKEHIVFKGVITNQYARQMHVFALSKSDHEPRADDKTSQTQVNKTELELTEKSLIAIIEKMLLDKGTDVSAANHDSTAHGRHVCILYTDGFEPTDQQDYRLIQMLEQRGITLQVHSGIHRCREFANSWHCASCKHIDSGRGEWGASCGFGCKFTVYSVHASPDAWQALRARANASATSA